MTEHKQIEVKGIRPNKKPWSAIVDKELADIIVELNNSGIKTICSCQGSKSTLAYIATSYLNSKKKVHKVVELLHKKYPKKAITLIINDKNGIFDFTVHNITTKQTDYLVFSGCPMYIPDIQENLFGKKV